jgi:hypothetical protein
VYFPIEDLQFFFRGELAVGVGAGAYLAADGAEEGIEFSLSLVAAVEFLDEVEAGVPPLALVGVLGFDEVAYFLDELGVG